MLFDDVNSGMFHFPDQFVTKQRGLIEEHMDGALVAKRFAVVIEGDVCWRSRLFKEHAKRFLDLFEWADLDHERKTPKNEDDWPGKGDILRCY